MKIILITFVTLTLISSNCTMKTQHILEYKPEKLQTQNLNKINIEPKGIIEIEEDENNIIQQITSVAIIGESNTLALINGKDLLFYDNTTGKFIKKIEATFEMTDLVAKSGRKPYIDSNYERRKVEVPYISTTNYTQNGIDGEIAQQFIKNFFMSLKNINNTFYSFGTIYCYYIGSSEKSIDNIPVLFVLNDELNIESYVVMDLNKNSHAIAYDFYINNYIYLSAPGMYKVPAFGGEFDSYPTAAKYDLEGNFIKSVSHMTNNYLLKGGLKNGWVYPRFIEVNNHIMIVYPEELAVFGENKKLFDLQNLPFKNDSGFVYYQDYLRYCRSKEMRPDIDVIARLFPIKIIDAFENENKFYPIILVWDKNKPMGFYYLIQEYTSDGKLLREVALDDEPENQIRQFAFNKYDKELVLFKKSKTSWTAEKWSLR
ncbi:MAG: hypothetical protein KGZ71_02235 [Desulfobulbaceae bacterium]|nr:hypothetical protein [Desulfobulbaceae bacterium]